MVKNRQILSITLVSILSVLLLAIPVSATSWGFNSSSEGWTSMMSGVCLPSKTGYDGSIGNPLGSIYIDCQNLGSTTITWTSPLFAISIVPLSTNILYNQYLTSNSGSVTVNVIKPDSSSVQVYSSNLNTFPLSSWQDISIDTSVFSTIGNYRLQITYTLQPGTTAYFDNPTISHTNYLTSESDPIAMPYISSHEANWGNGGQGTNGTNGTNLTLVSVTDNLDCTYTWHYSDGNSSTTGNLCGAKGDKGDAGMNGTDNGLKNITAASPLTYTNNSGNITIYDNRTDYHNQTVADNKPTWDLAGTALQSETDPLSVHWDDFITAVHNNETDTIAMANISNNIHNWNLAITALQSFVETDPIATLWIQNNASNWNLWALTDKAIQLQNNTNQEVEIAGKQPSGDYAINTALTNANVSVLEAGKVYTNSTNTSMKGYVDNVNSSVYLNITSVNLSMKGYVDNQGFLTSDIDDFISSLNSSVLFIWSGYSTTAYVNSTNSSNTQAYKDWSNTTNTSVTQAYKDWSNTSNSSNTQAYKDFINVTNSSMGLYVDTSTSTNLSLSKAYTNSTNTSATQAYKDFINSTNTSSTQAYKDWGNGSYVSGSNTTIIDGCGANLTCSGNKVDDTRSLATGTAFAQYNQTITDVLLKNLTIYNVTITIPMTSGKKVNGECLLLVNSSVTTALPNLYLNTTGSSYANFETFIFTTATATATSFTVGNASLNPSTVLTTVLPYSINWYSVQSSAGNFTIAMKSSVTAGSTVTMRNGTWCSSIER